MAKKWWQDAVVYQIYPQSFMDSNGDGIGDLCGIKQRLDYLEELGVSAIWLNPIYDSPNCDNGYDIRDYYAIMSDFGDMHDFDVLVSEAHALGIRIIMDMVVNHTSDEHIWFLESRNPKASVKRDYYIWHDGKDDGPPNNWGSFFSPSAWQYDEQIDKYYLHLFSKKQPDLNWENVQLREEIYSMMNWWLDKGVDGFRLDAINGIKKPKGLPDSKLPPTYAQGTSLDPNLYFNNPGLLDLFHEMNDKVLSREDIMSIGECSETSPEYAAEYASLNGDALSMLIHFDAVSLRDKWSVAAMRKVQQHWVDATWGKAWSSQYLSNHDQPRQVSIYGNDKRYLTASAKLIATMIHTLPGTPFIYQGEELGMTNIRMKSINDYHDVSAHNDYFRMTDSSMSKRKALEWLNHYSRDNARTPMQWDDTENAGFTYGKPWLKVNPNYKKINAKIQMSKSDSVFRYYQSLIALRRKNPVIIYGNYTDISPDGKDIYMYTRKHGETTWLVILNFSSRLCTVNISPIVTNVVLSNYPKAKIINNRIKCPPWYAAIIEVI